jgi:hypothetical protein
MRLEGGVVGMGKTKKTAAAVMKPRDPEAAARWRRAMLHTLGVVILAGLLGGGVYLDRGYVEHKLLPPGEPPRVVLKNKPVWMTDFLAEQIARAAQPAGMHSAFDHQLLVDTVTLLKANPWIREVHQVRRAYGDKPGDTLEVDCEYRAPVALVHWKDYFWLVDGDGIKLPEAFGAADIPRIVMGQDGHMNIRVVEGVGHAPPESGTKWPGEDLHAGLDLVKLLYGRSYAEEIEKVDVSNFARRHDPKAAQLVLITKYNTEVRWGIPVTVTDDNFFVEVSPAQKLAYMEAIVKEKGRVDGHFPWVDIRFDAVTHPSIGNAQTAGAELQR